jgi:DHA2 family multidrug resistance protein
MLNEQITRQARVIGYIDDFKLMLVLAIVVLPLLLLTRPSPSGVKPSATRSADRR